MAKFHLLWLGLVSVAAAGNLALAQSAAGVADAVRYQGAAQAHGRSGDAQLRSLTARLRLDANQQARIQAIFEQRGAAMRTLIAKGQWGQAYDDWEKGKQAEIEAVLTPDQRQRLKASLPPSQPRPDAPDPIPEAFLMPPPRFGESGPSTSDPKLATQEAPFENSLGMKFVPVPITGGPTSGKRVLFSIWDTRVQDYAAIMAGFPSPRWVSKDDWKNARHDGERQGPTHPVVNVDVYEAQAFCAWLTRRERQAGKLRADERYRLPTDHEWSCAAGLGDREDGSRSPAVKDGKLATIYPWGSTWPPPPNVGNFRPELKVDTFGFTSPVGSFPPNAHGLYDLGGNVWQWCQDRFSESHTRVQRGFSWKGGWLEDPDSLNASRRWRVGADFHQDDAGFRCVLAVGDPEPAGSPPPESQSRPGTPDARSATPALPFENSLGMKFVPVPIVRGPTGGQRVLFGVWDTRVQDYAVFAAETQTFWLKPHFDQGPTHPAVNVSCDDARAFCAWLTERDRKAGMLPADEHYRLPTDHEWSCAAGIGDREVARKAPEKKRFGIPDEYPWGTVWPPPEASGNFPPGFRADAFPYTSPVGTFPANRYGLHDLGGNVWQWCDDEITRGNPYYTSQAVRGASWARADRSALLLSERWGQHRVLVAPNIGFRCVVVPDAPRSRRMPSQSAPAPGEAGVAAPDPADVADLRVAITGLQKSHVRTGNSEYDEVGFRWQLEGRALALAKGYRIVLNGAKDQDGTPLERVEINSSLEPSLAPLVDGAERQGRSDSFLGERVTFVPATRKGAVTAIQELTGQVELLVPSRDPSSVVTGNFTDDEGLPLEAGALIAAGVEITLLEPDPSPTGSVGISGVDTPIYKLEWELSDPNHKLAAQATEFFDPSGARLPTYTPAPFRRSSGAPARQTLDCTVFAKPPPDTVARFYLITDKSLVSVPFVLRDIPVR